MNLEVTEIDLQNIKSILDELKSDSRLIEKSERMPISSIVWNVATSDKAVTEVVLAFIPLPEDVFGDIKILQFFCEIPGTPQNLNEVLALSLTNRLNYVVSIGSFGLRENRITFRCCHTMPIFTDVLNEKESISDILNMIMLYLETFRNPMIKVLEGTMTTDEMMSALQ